MKKTESEPHFLIVTAKETPSHLVFPKGYIENDEEPTEAALREVREEPGVKACVNGTVGYGKYEADKETVRVKFYLMKYFSEQMEKRSQSCDKSDGAILNRRCHSSHLIQEGFFVLQDTVSKSFL